MSRIVNWKVITDRFKTRLSRWKANLLSIGGRLSLIKSVLGSLGIYYFSIFKAPEAIIKDLECLRASFFWGASEDKKKLAWIKWPNILASFDKGGLGVGSLKAFNSSMLLKWRRRLLSTPGLLWVKVVKSIQGEEEGIDLKGCQTNGLWASNVGTINHLHSSDIVPLISIRFNVGDGYLIRFWKDTWLGDSPLHIRYNRLYRLERNKNCLIRYRIVNGCWSWDWYRPVTSGRSYADLINLLKEIGSLEMVDGGDCFSCSLSQDGSYSVSNIRKHIDDVMLPNYLPCTRWFKVIPKKINIFMWRFFMDRLPHRLNLSKWGLDIHSILCPSCNRNVESNVHIFFSCDTAFSIWNLVRVLCNYIFPVLNSCEDWNSWFSAWHASKASKDRAYAIFAASCWLIWRFCNNVTFNSQSMRKCDISDNIRLASFSWLKSRDKLCNSWNDWLQSPL